MLRSLLDFARASARCAHRRARRRFGARPYAWHAPEPLKGLGAGTPMLASFLALIACNGRDTDTDAAIDASPIRSCDVLVSLARPDGAEVLELAGAWSDWEPQPMSDDDGDGVFARDLGELRPSVYGYKFVIDGVWETVPADVPTTWNDGVENRALRVGDCERPQLNAIAGTATPMGEVEATFQFTRAADGAGLDEAAITATIGGDPADVEVDRAAGTLRVHASGLASGKRSVRLHVVDTAGRSPENGDGFVPLWVEPVPYEWQRGLLYYVFLDRFKDGGDHGLGPIAGTVNGTDYLGGDLVGAKQVLDDGYFDALGVSAIWLSPVNQNPDASYRGSDGVTNYSGYHGYWPTRGREVEDRLGTTTVPADEALKAFVDAAHEHGIRVLLDVALNHVHEDHEYLDQHPDWFSAAPCPCTTDAGACNWDTNPIGCWFTDYLPDLDYKNQEVVDQSVADLLWWAETYDVDGFRVDAAKHMDHVILRTASLTLKDRYERAGGAHYWTVGETFTGRGGQGLIMNYVAPYELDGQFDFPLLYPIRDAIGHQAGFGTLASEVRASDDAYGDAKHWMSVFMGNHDVGRYATDLAGCPTWALFGGCRDVLDEGATDAMTGEEWDLVNPLAQSFAFVATQPGVPLLYYGDEIGLAGAGDPDNRRMMRFDDLSLAQSTLLDRFRELGQTRNQLSALHRGERVELWVDDSLYVYARDAGGGDVAIVAMATQARTQAVPIPTRLALEGRAVHNALADNHQGTVSSATLNLSLGASEYVVLTPDD
jgi:neopullulanase